MARQMLIHKCISISISARADTFDTLGGHRRLLVQECPKCRPWHPFPFPFAPPLRAECARGGGGRTGGAGVRRVLPGDPHSRPQFPAASGTARGMRAHPGPRRCASTPCSGEIEALRHGSEVFRGEGASGMGFEMAFEGHGLFAGSKSDRCLDAPRATVSGMRQLARVVIVDPRIEVVSGAGVVSASLVQAREDIGVVERSLNPLWCVDGDCWPAWGYFSTRWLRPGQFGFAFGYAVAGSVSDRGAKTKHGGADGDRTHDLSIANAALSQLSYGPTRGGEYSD